MLSDDDIDRLAGGRHGDPFAVLGPHSDASGLTVVRTLLPLAAEVAVTMFGARQRVRLAIVVTLELLR